MKKAKLFDRVMNSLDLQNEPLPKIPLLELLGTGRILIENHRGVLVYRCCEIKISVRYGCICITGRNLQLVQMSKDRLVVTGTIEGIHLIRREQCASNANG